MSDVRDWLHLEAVSGLSQQALIIDMAAKILADNITSLMCSAGCPYWRRTVPQIVDPDQYMSPPPPLSLPGARLSNLVNGFRNERRTVPVGPFRCLPMMISATPGSFDCSLV